MRIFAFLQFAILILFVPLGIYLGLKIKKLMAAWRLPVRPLLFWPAFLLVTGAAVFSRSVFLLFFFYLGLIFLLYDAILLILVLLGRIFPAKRGKPEISGQPTGSRHPEKIWRLLGLQGLTPLLLAVVISAYGYYNAGNVIIKEYNIQMPYPRSALEKLEIIFISDIHAGTALKQAEMARMAKQIADLKPDVIIFGGDIFDNDSTALYKEQFYRLFGNIASTYGAFYIHGNHDRRNETRLEMEQAGIIVLADEYRFFEGGFYLIGRKDQSMSQRLSLAALTESFDPSYPVILADHRPTELKQAGSLGIDLLLAGHTHKGQIFPGNLLIGRFNEMDYGYKRIGNTQIIVSSGAGTWSFPFRIGSHSEMLHITVKFK